jgi:hypothetical protein
MITPNGFHSIEDQFFGLFSIDVSPVTGSEEKEVSSPNRPSVIPIDGVKYPATQLNADNYLTGIQLTYALVKYTIRRIAFGTDDGRDFSIRMNLKAALRDCITKDCYMGSKARSIADDFETTVSREVLMQHREWIGSASTFCLGADYYDAAEGSVGTNVLLRFLVTRVPDIVTYLLRRRECRDADRLLPLMMAAHFLSHPTLHEAEYTRFWACGMMKMLYTEANVLLRHYIRETEYRSSYLCPVGAFFYTILPIVSNCRVFERPIDKVRLLSSEDDLQYLARFYTPHPIDEDLRETVLDFTATNFAPSPSDEKRYSNPEYDSDEDDASYPSEDEDGEQEEDSDDESEGEDGLVHIKATSIDDMDSIEY